MAWVDHRRSRRQTPRLGYSESGWPSSPAAYTSSSPWPLLMREEDRCATCADGRLRAHCRPMSCRCGTESTGSCLGLERVSVGGRGCSRSPPRRHGALGSRQ
ncbi:hypothetical protein HYQ46_005976 [Verticillium longisporum]|nr:hypothetical protein HYQ46_005976 [Verticillium longisporum]